MLTDDGIENGQKKTKQTNKATTTTTATMIGPVSKKKKTTLHVQHSFLHISLLLLLHDYNVKLSSYTFTEEMLYVLPKNWLLVFLFAFFFTATYFLLTGC